MRTPIYVLVAALFIGGCTHHHHAAPSATPPAQVDRIEVPEPEPVEPLELDVGRPSGTQLLLQTNRPAYVAIYEIIPNRSVSLIYPAAAHQQNMMVSGLTWVPLWWSPKRVVFNSDRYIYAIASEEPLRLSAETFEADYLRRVLGARIYGAESPYSTMRSISRQVVPDVAPEAWAEDVSVIEPTYATQVRRIARIHCPGGRVFEVPDDMVSRIWCPTRTRVVIVDGSRPRTRDYPVSRPVRPDSVFGHGGGRVRLEPRRPRGPIARIVDPTGRDRDDRDRDPRRRGRPERADKDEKEKARKNDDKDSDDQKAKDEKPKDEKPKDEKPKKDNDKDSDDKDKPKKDDDKDSDKPKKNDNDDDSDDKRKKAKEKQENDRSRGPSWFKPRRAADEPPRREADDRKDEPKQQGDAREEKRDAKPEEKPEEKREEKREAKPTGRLKDLVKQVKEKKEQEEKEKEKKDKP